MCLRIKIWLWTRAKAWWNLAPGRRVWLSLSLVRDSGYQRWGVWLFPSGFPGFGGHHRPLQLSIGLRMERQVGSETRHVARETRRRRDSLWVQFKPIDQSLSAGGWHGPMIGGDRKRFFLALQRPHH